MKTFVVNENDAGQRVDKFVLKVTTALPKSLLYKSIRTKKIKVNRKRCAEGQLLAEGDVVDLFLAPDFFEAEENAFLRLEPRLSFVYEDGNLLICDKPEGVSCHSDEKQKTGTLIDHIKAYLYKKGEYRPDAENSFAPALCNRIDRNTTGLVICAKNAAALREMNRMLKNRLVEKRYLALITGIPAQKKATLTHYLIKDEKQNRVRVFDAPQKGALTAVTEYRVIKENREKNLCLVEILLHTGRTHQIRAQMAHIGYPLAGDAKYGADRQNPVFRFQALRAFSLRFFPEENSLFFYLSGKEILAPFDKKFEL